MSKDNSNRFSLLSNPVLWGGLATALIMLGVISILFTTDCNHTIFGGETCQAKIITLKKSPPNEIGDALAGVAGTLAFLWIIITVWLQSSELSAQREELSLARAESARMASALEAQTDVFREEQKQRRETRADATISALLEEIVAHVSRNQLGSPSWRYTRNHTPKLSDNILSQSLNVWSKADQPTDIRFLTIFHHSLPASINSIQNIIPSVRAEEIPKRPPEINETIESLRTVLDVSLDSSEAMKSRLRKIEAKRALDRLEDLYRREDFWAETEDTP